MKRQIDDQMVHDAILVIVNYIDDKPGTRTLFQELLKLLVEELHKEEE